MPDLFTPAVELVFPKIKPITNLKNLNCLFENKLDEILNAKEKKFAAQALIACKERNILLHKVEKNNIVSYLPTLESYDKSTKLFASLITPVKWDLNWRNNIKELSNVKINDIIRLHYYNIAVPNNFFGCLPSIILVRVHSQEQESITEPLIKNERHNPTTKDLDNFYASNLGQEIITICNDFGLEIKEVIYKPFKIQMPINTPYSPLTLGSGKSVRIIDKEGEGELEITTSLASDPRFRKRY